MNPLPRQCLPWTRHRSGHLWSESLHHRQIGNPACSRVNSEDTARTRARTGTAVGAVVTAREKPESSRQRPCCTATRKPSRWEQSRAHCQRTRLSQLRAVGSEEVPAPVQGWQNPRAGNAESQGCKQGKFRPAGKRAKEPVEGAMALAGSPPERGLASPAAEYQRGARQPQAGPGRAKQRLTLR